MGNSLTASLHRETVAFFRLDEGGDHRALLPSSLPPQSARSRLQWSQILSFSQPFAKTSTDNDVRVVFLCLANKSQGEQRPYFFISFEWIGLLWLLWSTRIYVSKPLIVVLGQSLAFPWCKAASKAKCTVTELLIFYEFPTFKFLENKVIIKV